MDVNLPELISNLVTLLTGSLISWSVWVTTSYFRLKKDIDAAHYKIRLWELKNVRNDCKAGDDSVDETDDGDLSS